MGTIRSKAISGLKWSTAGRGAQVLIQIVQYAILARILTPADFGLYSMTNIVLGFSMRLGDAGLNSAVIQSKEMNRRRFSTLFFLSLLIGILIFAGINLVAAPVERFFKTDGLIELLFLGSIIFLVIPFGKMYQSMFQKELMFDTVIKIEFVGKLLGASIAVLLAFMGKGVVSLIWGLVADHGFRYLTFFVLGYRIHYRLQLVFRLREVRYEVMFGLNTLGTTFMNYFGSRIDKILIGRFLGEGALGFYEIAYNLVLQPLFNVRPILNRVALPSFAKIQDDREKIKKYYFDAMEYLSLLATPLMIGIALTAKSIVMILYGPQWEASIILVEILALVALFELLGDTFRSVLLALGKPRKTFYWEIYVTILTMVAIGISVQFGILVVAFALLATRVLNFFVKYFWMVRSEFSGVSADYFFRTFLLQLLYCIPMVLVLVLLNRYLPEFEAYIQFVINGLAGFALYFTMVLLFEKRKIAHVRSFIGLS